MMFCLNCGRFVGAETTHTLKQTMRCIVNLENEEISEFFEECFEKEKKPKQTPKSVTISVGLPVRAVAALEERAAELGVRRGTYLRILIMEAMKTKELTD